MNVKDSVKSFLRRDDGDYRAAVRFLSDPKIQKAVLDNGEYIDISAIVAYADRHRPEIDETEATPVLCDAPEDPEITVLELQKKIFVLEAEIEERRRITDQVLTLLKPFATVEEPAPLQTPVEPVSEGPKLVDSSLGLVDGSSYVTCDLGFEPHVYSATYCFNAKVSEAA